MECECRSRRGHETLALPAKVMEVTLTQATEIRRKILEMAMPAVQQTRLAKMDMLNVWLGVEDPKPNSGSSSDPADERTGRGARHDDADRQPVPGGADEKDRKSNSAKFRKQFWWEGESTPPKQDKHGKESCGSSKQDAHDSAAENEGDNDGDGTSEHRGGSREGEGGTCERPRHTPRHATERKGTP